MFDWNKVLHYSFVQREMFEHWHEPEGAVAGTILLVIILIILIWNGIMAGLTVGLMSIDEMKLKLLKETGTEKEKLRIKKLETLLSDKHFLLCVVLIGNCIGMESLPLVMSKIMPEWLTIVLSVTSLLIAGEIIPMAICLADPLKFGARFTPLLWALYYVFWPIAKLITILLGCLVGHQHDKILLTKAELYAFIDLHEKNSKDNISHSLTNYDENSQYLLDHDTATIMRGALKMRSKTVMSALTPIIDVYMLQNNQTLDDNLLIDIVDMGHSRVPIYQNDNRHHVVGMLLVKNLITLETDKTKSLKVQDAMNTFPLVFPDKLPLLDALNLFQTGKSHLALVTKKPNEVQDVFDGSGLAENIKILGIITLEDVIEELIQEDIHDEADRESKLVAFSFSVKSVASHSKEIETLAISK